MFKITVEGRTLEDLKVKIAELCKEMIIEPEGLVVTKEPVEDIFKEEVTTPMSTQVTTELPKSEVKETPVQKVDANTQLDGEGLPWDKRIHSSGQTIDRKGFWIKKRKVDPVLVAEVKNELRAAMQSNGISVAKPVEQIVIPVEQTPVVPPAMSVGNGHTVETFIANFPMVIGALITEGKINQPYIEELKKFFNVPEIYQISDGQKSDLFESFVAGGLIQKV